MDFKPSVQSDERPREETNQPHRRKSRMAAFFQASKAVFTVIDGVEMITFLVHIHADTLHVCFLVARDGRSSRLQRPLAAYQASLD